MKTQKEKFRISEIKKVITSFDRKLADVLRDLYERSIDCGSHPNPHAAMSTVDMPDPSSPSFTILALSTDDTVLLQQ
jgi:hypothetical protein